MNRLEEISQRLKAATPGPWTGAENGSCRGEGFVVATTLSPSEKDDVDEWFVCRIK
jgi:hypothetical protein